MLNKNLLLTYAQTSSIFNIRVRNDYRQPIKFEVVFYTYTSDVITDFETTISEGSTIDYKVDLTSSATGGRDKISLRAYYATPGNRDLVINAPSVWFPDYFATGSYTYYFYEKNEFISNLMGAPDLDNGYLFTILMRA